MSSRSLIPAALRVAGALAVMWTAVPVGATSRIKDIATWSGVRSNQLVGYGLVVGLAGTGDRLRNAPFTEVSLAAMLERMGVSVKDRQLRTQNVAAVAVTATLPAFARAGSTFDVQVAALGDATNLQGGTLVATRLTGLDDQVYAIAQGPVAVSGFAARGAAATISRGSTTSARIANGAIVEREVPFAFSDQNGLRLGLRNPDFTTARRIAEAITRAGFRATAVDNATVEISPASQAGVQLAAIVAQIENLPIEADQRARIIVDEASGTVVIGDNVRISRVAIAQGGLTVTVSETPVVSQPAPFGRGETTVVPRTTVGVDDGGGAKLALAGGGASLSEIVNGLNALGVSPRDLITILQAMRAAGALQADIEVR